MNKYMQLANNIMLVIMSVAIIYTTITNKDTIARYETAVNNYKQDNAILVELSESLINYTTSVNEELQLRQDLTSLIIDASRSYNIDPKLLAITIKSESNFRPNPQHALPHVKGSAGINVKANNKLKHNASSYVGNVYASAEILAGYIETSDSLTLALTRYKGLSPQGFGQAKDIIKEYNKQ